NRGLLSLGVVGFGKLGLLHAALANALADSRLAAVADSQSQLLSVLKSQMPTLLTFRTHTEMLQGVKLDGVLIATPTHAHIPVAIDCVRAGIPTFIEKPLGISAAQTEPLLREVASTGVPTMVGFMIRFHETFRKAREIIQANVLGRLQNLRATMYISQIMKS